MYVYMVHTYPSAEDTLIMLPDDDRYTHSRVRLHGVGSFLVDVTGDKMLPTYEEDASPGDDR